LESDPSSGNGSDEKGHLATCFLNEYTVDSPTPQNFFDIFKSAYPEYLGPYKFFVGALVYIDWLRERKMLHPSLWDDFIRVFATDYHEYLDKNYSKKPLMTGLEFYDQVEQRTYQRAIITRFNLQEAISTLDQKRVARYRKKFARNVTKPSSVLTESEPSVASRVPRQARVSQASVTVTDMEKAQESQAEGDDACEAELSIVEDNEFPKSKVNSLVMATSEEHCYQPTHTEPSNFEEVPVQNRHSQKRRIDPTSPELVLFEDDVSDVCDRSISLELGSENYGSEKPSRKPFFETFSQLPRNNQNQLPIDDDSTTTRSPKNVPWRQSHSPRTPGMLHSRLRKDNSWSTTPGARNSKLPDPIAGGRPPERTFLGSPESRIRRSMSSGTGRQVPDSEKQPRSDPSKKELQSFPKSRRNNVVASTPSAQKKSKGFDSPERPNRNHSRSVFKGSPASPILGTLEKSSGLLKPQRGPESTKSVSHESHSFKKSSLPLSKMTPLQKAGLNRDERVKEWVEDQTTEQPSLKRKASSLSFKDRCEMLAAKRRRSNLVSNVSIPNSTPQRRICTKPAGATPVEEPMTQKWEF
jgi:hypothetical protein